MQRRRKRVEVKGDRRLCGSVPLNTQHKGVMNAKCLARSGKERNSTRTDHLRARRNHKYTKVIMKQYLNRNIMQ